MLLAGRMAAKWQHYPHHFKVDGGHSRDRQTHIISLSLTLIYPDVSPVASTQLSEVAAMDKTDPPSE